MSGWKLGRCVGVAVVVALAFTLSACLLTPGKFTSALDMRKDGRFTFSYAGEIHLLALSKLAQMGNSGRKTFKAEPCLDDDLKEHACTPAQLAEQKRAYEEARKSEAEKATKDAEGMKALMGGIDPSSPQAAEELAARLRRQTGWKSVIYKGDGLFVVDFAIAGQLDHDFTFPTIERFPMANAFVQLSRRSDGTVRVDAPGFAAGAGAGNPLQAMLSGGLAAEGTSATPTTPPPQFDGVFTITTDGVVLANNTDEGPHSDPAGQKLAWTVNARSAAAPTALIKLGN